MSYEAEMKPELIADVTLYPASAGGRKAPITAAWFACPCKVYKDSQTAWDCRLLLEGQSLSPGETKRLGVCFLSGEKAAQIFRAAGKFYLWEAGIIGEAVVVSAF
jgi:hypothetical protein